MQDNVPSQGPGNDNPACADSLRDGGHRAGFRSRLSRLSEFVSVVVLTLYVPVAVYAQTKPASGTGNRHFSAAPVPKSDEEANSLDYIMGVHVNTLFFVAVGVVALFWFTLGGGRKAKNLGRQND